MEKAQKPRALFHRCLLTVITGMYSCLFQNQKVINTSGGEDYSKFFMVLLPLPKQRGRAHPGLKQNVSMEFRGKEGKRTGLGSQTGLGHR